VRHGFAVLRRRSGRIAAPAEGKTWLRQIQRGARAGVALSWDCFFRGVNYIDVAMMISRRNMTFLRRSGCLLAGTGPQARG
jgi:hypothetical protein